MKHTQNSSFPRKRESRFPTLFKGMFKAWIPAFAGMTALCLVISSFLKAAPVDIQIDRYAQKYNLGVSDFLSSASDKGMVDGFEAALMSDLKYARIFNLVQNGPIIQKRQDVKAWGSLGSEVVLGGTFKTGKAGLEASSKLYDVGKMDEVLSFNATSSSADTRSLAHRVANEVVKYFTGLPGIFNSKLAFVNDSTGRKELYVADYDGRNIRRMTNDNSIVILPRVSPDGQKVIFTSYLKGNPDLYIMNMAGGDRKRLSSKVGLNVSPSWSPNNREVALTLSIDGPPNIYLMDLGGTIIRRITDGLGADTAPSFSPDGNQIAFTSDRAGAPHIYITNIDGTGLRRITTVGHCDSAAWSPNGQTIVYVKSEAGNRFDLYSIEVLTGIERRLTWGPGDNENPTWSPDGRFIVFVSNRRKKTELYSMLADGSDQQSLGIPKGQSFTPHWSN